MQICFISSGYIENDPRYYFLANSFKNAGYEVFLVNVCCYRNTKRNKQNISRNYNIIDIDFFKYIPAEIKAMCSQDINDFSEKLIPCFIENYLKKHSDMDFLTSDIFYGLEGLYGGIMAQLFGQKLNKQFIIDFKELFSEMDSNCSIESKKIIENIEASYIKSAILIPCVSQRIINFYVLKYPEYQNKFILLENSRPFDELKPNFNNSINKKIKFIVSAGNANIDRGFRELTEIWEGLNHNNAELYIRVSYITEEEKNMIINIGKKTYQKSLFFIPPVSEDALVISLLDYDCGIIPYLSDANLNQKYCCPNKFGQYMNAGLAVIASNTEYITERVVKYNLGIIYNPKNIKASIEAFNNLINNRKNLLKKRRNAYLYAKKKYEWNEDILPLLNAVNKKTNNLRKTANNIWKKCKDFL